MVKQSENHTLLIVTLPENFTCKGNVKASTSTPISVFTESANAEKILVKQR